MSFEAPEIIQGQADLLPTGFNRELLALMLKWSGESRTAGRTIGFIADVENVTNRYFDKIDNFRVRGASVDATVTTIGRLKNFVINRAGNPAVPGDVEPPLVTAAT